MFQFCRLLCFLPLIVLLPLSQAVGDEEPTSELPYFRVAGSGGRLDTLPLKAIDARIEIVGTIADVELVQTFANVGERPIEAVYVFPGSNRSAVYAMQMRIGDRVIDAQISKKEEARRTYEAAKREGKAASLLVQHRPNVFEMNLANIMPGDVIEVSLRYTEWIAREKQECEYVLPLLVGPCFSEQVEGWEANPHLDDSEAQTIQVGVRAVIRQSVSLEEAVCISHAAPVRFEDTRTAIVSIEGDASTVGNRDFVLKYRISGDEIKSGILLSESNGENYFMATIEPPVSIDERKRMPREYFFIVDVSGSMRGFPLNTAKEMLSSLAARLDEEDRFNLMLFAGDSEVFSDRPVEASVENLLAAIEFLHSKRGGGGTRLLPALERVYATERDPEFSRSIVVLTDGYISVEEDVFELVRQKLNQANVYACGIGSAPNRHLIDGMAAVGGGMPFYVQEASQSSRVANRFSEYVSMPVLSQISFSFGGFEAYDVEPLQVPDLLAERPIVLFGKYVGEANGKLFVSGRQGESAYQTELDIANAVDLAGSRSLEYVWARERIRRLDDYSKLWPSGERAKEVTELGLKHSLLTRYTSFVAVDQKVRNLEATESVKVKQAVALPKGMDQSQFIGGQAVPVTPEPRMWAMIGCVLVTITWILVRKGL